MRRKAEAEAAAVARQEQEVMFCSLLFVCLFVVVVVCLLYDID
jgi:flagellar biogenesis protein FliO